MTDIGIPVYTWEGRYDDLPNIVKYLVPNGKIKSPTTILVRARDYLAKSKKRWITGELADRGVGRCAVGACYEAAGIDARYLSDSGFKEKRELVAFENSNQMTPAFREAVAFLDDAAMQIAEEKFDIERCWSVTNFNDEYAQTRDDVLAVFDRAIKLSRKAAHK